MDGNVQDKFAKYKEIVEGKTKIVLKDEEKKTEEVYDIIVPNSEKMVILNYSTAQAQASKRLVPVPKEFNAEIEGLFLEIFKRSYPRSDLGSIKNMISNRFMELVTACSIGFGWTTEEKINEAMEEYKSDVLGAKKKSESIIKKN